MPASLLPTRRSMNPQVTGQEPASDPTFTARVQQAEQRRDELCQRIRETFPAWPTGFGLARILLDYLLGRQSAVLDISGRWHAAGEHSCPAPEAANQPAPKSDPAPSLKPSLTPLPTLVIDDDEGGALGWVASLIDASSVQVFNDRIDAEAPSQLSLEPHLSLAPLASQQRTIVAAPKAKDSLREYLERYAAQSTEFIVVVREKHSGRWINELLAEFYHRVDVSPGVAKARLIIGSAARSNQGKSTTVTSTFPRTVTTQACPLPAGITLPPLTVHAFGGCYSGTSVDPGSALLLRALAEHRAELPEHIGTLMDLGCGNGWLLSAAALVLQPQLVHGIDVSRAAMRSAQATLAANLGAGAGAKADSGTSGGAGTDANAGSDAALPAGQPEIIVDLADTTALTVTGVSADVILLNPPFHSGHSIETDTAHRLVDAAHRLLAPGGMLVLVHNSHLRYRSHLHHRFSAVQQWARDPRFTVLAAQSS